MAATASSSQRIVVAVSGASGALYGLDLLQKLAQLGGYEVHLVVSPGARRVLAAEGRGDGPSLADLADLAQINHDPGDLAAAIASGSFPVRAMAVCPCSMRTLAAIASGAGDTLVHRAADVTLKERRPLVLVTREAPLSRIHLANMLAAHDAGATILPASPPFYGARATVADLVSGVSARVLTHLGIDHAYGPRWGEDV